MMEECELVSSGSGQKHWQALVNMVTNTRVPQKAGKRLTK